jgi:putative RecB family exonuclease
MNLPVLANPANEVARSMTGRDYLSYSQVSTYQACPLKWYFQYIANLPHEQVSASLVFGGAIHAAIEHYYLALMAGEEAPGLEQLVRVFDRAWKADALAPVRFGKDESLDSLRELAGRMLAAFLQSEAAVVNGAIVAVEEEIRATYIDGVPDLLARIDLVVLTEDGVVVRDFKTSRTAWGADKLAEAAPQLLLYGDLSAPIADAFGGRPVKMEYVVVTKAKAPVVETLPVEPDAHRLTQGRRIIERVWESMKAGHVYPNPSPLNCSGCPFQRACRAWCD